MKVSLSYSSERIAGHFHFLRDENVEKKTSLFVFPQFPLVLKHNLKLIITMCLNNALTERPLYRRDNYFKSMAVCFARRHLFWLSKVSTLIICQTRFPVHSSFKVWDARQDRVSSIIWLHQCFLADFFWPLRELQSRKVMLSYQNKEKICTHLVHSSAFNETWVEEDMAIIGKQEDPENASTRIARIKLSRSLRWTINVKLLCVCSTN